MSIHWGGRGAGHISRWSTAVSTADLSLNFLTGILDPRITFSRGTTATFVGSNGLIQSAAINAPRFDYDPVTLAAKGLLIEEGRTNLVKQSADFTNAEWSITGIASRTNDSSAPNGTTTGCTLIENTSTSVHNLLAAGTNRPVTGAVVVTATLYIKAGTRRYVNVSAENSGNGYNATIDTVGWTITQQSLTGTGWTSGSATLTPAGSGWYRLNIIVTPAAATGVVLIVAGAPASSSIRQVSYLGDSSTFIIWGAQLEAGAFATSYIPTVASQVTRSADAASMTGANFSSWFNATQGTFVTQASSFGIGSNLPTFLNASDGTANNYLRMNGASGYTGRAFIQSGGATSANITVGAGLTSGVTAKTASAYIVNSFQLAVNATLGTEDTSGAVPVTPNQIAFGNWFGSAGTYLNGHIRQISYYKTRLPNAQLQALTT